MADITLNVATWTARVVAADDDAVIALLVDYESYYSGQLDPTLEPEVRLQAMLEHLVRHVETVALAQREADVMKAAAEAAQADAPKWAA